MEIKKEFSLAGITGHFWVGTSPEAERSAVPPDLAGAVRGREIQGLIGACLNPSDSRWFMRLGVPLAAMGTARMASRVWPDFPHMFRSALQLLHRQGCRSVGLIVPKILGETVERPEEEGLYVFQKFLEEAQEVGIETRGSWVRTPPGKLLDRNYEEFGYRQFLELWGQAETPEGLIVYPDTVVRVVITALFQSRASVPDRLRLVFHRNEGVPILCPFPASWLVTSARKYAAALIRQIKHQIEGNPVHPIAIAASLTPEADAPNPEDRPFVFSPDRAHPCV